MIAQDTGSAIVGPARANIYRGAGDQASQLAGRIRRPGKFAIVLSCSDQSASLPIVG